MKFVIEIGEAVKQRVEFSFNQLLGRTVIKCDGRELKKTVRLFSEPTFDTHIFELADKERVSVRIDKYRKHLFGSKYLVYVNNRLTEFRQGV